MPSKVFFGSARQARLEAKETLPAKLDLILEQLHLRDRVNQELVVIKMHTGAFGSDFARATNFIPSSFGIRKSVSNTWNVSRSSNSIAASAESAR